jgi:hypothetical protein
MNNRLTGPNEKYSGRLNAAWSEVLEVIQQRGFFGTASVEIVVADGMIQQIRRKVEAIDRDTKRK